VKAWVVIGTRPIFEFELSQALSVKQQAGAS